MRLECYASERFVALRIGYAWAGIDEGGEVVVHEGLVHEDDVAFGKGRMGEGIQSWQGPVDGILAFGVEGDFAIVIGLDAVGFPGDFGVFIASVVELETASRSEDGCVVAVGSGWIDWGGQLWFCQFQGSVGELFDEEAVDEKFATVGDIDGLGQALWDELEEDCESCEEEGFWGRWRLHGGEGKGRGMGGFVRRGCL